MVFIFKRFTKRQIREKGIHLIRNKCGLTIIEIYIFHDVYTLMKSKTVKHI